MRPCMRSLCVRGSSLGRGLADGPVELVEAEGLDVELEGGHGVGDVELLQHLCVCARARVCVCERERSLLSSRDDTG